MTSTVTARIAPAADAHSDGGAEPLSRSVLVTLAYSDVFDHPLSEDELFRYLVRPGTRDREALKAVVRRLTGHQIAREDGLICLRGRESTVAIRHARTRAAADRWDRAERFARAAARIPFLEMIAVCGSQAMDHGGVEADIDLFLITAPRRLWLVQFAAMVLRRLIPGAHFCPNYLLTVDRLEVEPKNLYTAREAAQAVPLWGAEAYDRFLETNAWIASLMPNAADGGRRHRLGSRPPSRLRSFLERALGGRFGNGLDRLVHRLLLGYYSLRLRGHGWRRADVAKAYQRERQAVITGGYLGAVERRFTERVRTVLGDEAEAAVADCFGHETATADPLYRNLLDQNYGSYGDARDPIAEHDHQGGPHG